jgi:hypothetical protein
MCDCEKENRDTLETYTKAVWTFQISHQMAQTKFQLQVFLYIDFSKLFTYKLNLNV